ncbi:MAG: hypothetical protein J5I91_04625 [Bacteroidetes bacterium]|nr:hypothetical protein [Bacteroidota bacterium]
MEIRFKKIICFLFFVISTLSSYAQNDTDSTLIPDWDLFVQLQNKRVYNAALMNESILKKIFEGSNVSYPPRYIYWRAFKAEQELELWAKDSSSQPYKLIKTYPISRLCGDLGPKRREGDMQIPEGFYKVTDFNPNSSYWLSFKINYPNGSDSILGSKKRLGGNIFIHGDTVTIGCLPMTDSLIKEIYWLTILNKNVLDSSEFIPFHIYPIRLSNENWQLLYKEYWGDQTKIQFWNSLQGVYNYFENDFQIPEITIDDKGFYKVIYPTKNNQQNNGLSDSRLGESR